MMKEKYNIKELDKNDIALAVNLVRSSFNNDFLIPSIYRCKGIERFIANELENNYSPYKYFVICHDNVIVGFAEFKIFSNLSMAFLNIICTSNEYKNKGVGRILFVYCREYFIKNNFKSIQLDVYNTNVLALKWYSDFGFNQISSNSFYKIELNKENENSDPVYILNYPQYKELKKIFGFYFLNIAIGNENLKFGIIENDLFIRGKYNPSISTQLVNLSNSMAIKNIYFIGSSCQFAACKFIDEIVRMELNIRL